MATPFISSEYKPFATDVPQWPGVLAQSHTVQAKIDGLHIHDVISWQGSEALSQPFYFRAWLRLEKQKKIPDTLVGKSASFAFLDPGSQKVSQRFHGLVSRVCDGGGAFAQEDFPLISLEIHPTFWFLQQTRDYRIFSEKSAIEIITYVLNENNVSFNDRTEHSGTRVREFCVQYGESHFAFVSRLMEEEGIFYFFKYQEDKHILVLADENKACHALGEIPFGNTLSGGGLFEDRVYRIQRMQGLSSNRVALADYNFKKPDDNLYASRGGTSPLPLSLYGYPGRFEAQARGEALSEQRLKAEECLKVLFEGLSTNLHFGAGKSFKLKGYHDESFHKEYVLLSVSHFYGLDEARRWNFHNTFHAIPAKTPFKPREITPKPVAHQDTATVVGRKGEEIYTNEGQIKIKFHWDRRTEKDVENQDRSCWVRVASGWAGSGWGMMHTPRIGQEVVVVFLNHNPDCPLVIGSVYNGTHKPPYEKDITQSGVKSHTTKEGKDDNFNEIRFTDEKEKEEFFIQAEKDLKGIIKDSGELTVQKGSLTTTIERGDRKVTLKGEKDPTNGKGDDFLTLEKGSRTVELKGKDGNLETRIADGHNSLEIKKGSDEITLTDGDRIISLKKGKQEVTIKGGGYTLKITGGDVTIETTGHFKVNAKGGISLSTLGKMSLDCMEFSLTAKTKATISANLQLNMEGKAQASLKGAMATVEGQAMATVKAAMVMVN